MPLMRQQSGGNLPTRDIAQREKQERTLEASTGGKRNLQKLLATFQVFFFG
jgi:hypothetical protein